MLGGGGVAVEHTGQHSPSGALAIWQSPSSSHTTSSHATVPVANTGSTRLWAPYLIVGVGLAVFCAGIFMKQNSSYMSIIPDSLSVGSGSERVIMGFSRHKTITFLQFSQCHSTTICRKNHQFTKGRRVDHISENPERNCGAKKLLYET